MKKVKMRTPFDPRRRGHAHRRRPERPKVTRSVKARLRGSSRRRGRGQLPRPRYIWVYEDDDDKTIYFTRFVTLFFFFEFRPWSSIQEPNLSEAPDITTTTLAGSVCVRRHAG